MGPGPVDRHIQHSRQFAASLGEFSGHFLDLGSGAGVPGLLLAEAWPGARGTLLDSRDRSCASLEASVSALGLDSRIDVVCGRAEELARDPARREQYDLVVARGFGRPAITAESAVGFLTPTGCLAVTEPPERNEDRWPAAPLAQLGLSPPEYRPGCAILTRTGDPVDAWPRRRPASQPLW